MDGVPAAGNARSQQDDGDKCAGDIERHLDYVGPDDGGHSSFERVDQGQGADDGNGHHIPRADRHAHDDGDGEHTDALPPPRAEREKEMR